MLRGPDSRRGPCTRAAAAAEFDDRPGPQSPGEAAPVGPVGRGKRGALARGSALRQHWVRQIGCNPGAWLRNCQALARAGVAPPSARPTAATGLPGGWTFGVG